MKPKNIVLLVTDQLRPFEIGSYGGFLQTPNMDRLAANGVRFETAVSNNPVCSPARAILTSGQYSRSCVGMLGNWGPPEITRNRLLDPTLPEVMAGHGFFPAQLGKWHVHIHPKLAGFQNYESVEPESKPKFFPVRPAGGVSHPEFGPEGEERFLREFLTAADELPTPYFLFHNIHLPHGPWDVMSNEELETYSREDARLRPNVPEDLSADVVREWGSTYMVQRSVWEDDPDKRVPEGYSIEDMHRHYYAAVERADRGVGVLISELERRGELEDTLIVFTSDHGENLGSHGLFNKETMNEESIRIPMIFHWPNGLQPGVREDAIISLVDIAPTLLGLLGREAPSHFQGRDLSAVVRGERTALEPNVAFIEGMQDDIAIRTPTHLYSAKMQGGWNNNPKRTVKDEESQFYDLRTDPYELRNLAGGDEQREVAAKLRRQLFEWNRRTPWMNEK